MCDTPGTRARHWIVVALIATAFPFAYVARAAPPSRSAEYRELQRRLGRGSNNMVGPDVLVAPVTTEGAVTRNIYVPAGQWRKLKTGRGATSGRWLRGHPEPLPPALRRISRASLEDKIRGGWAGQMIGVSFGAPTEFHSNGRIIEGNLENFMDWSPDRIRNAIDQDDLYVEMTFAEVMDRFGLNATTEQYGEMFRNSKYDLWHANAAARRSLNQGLKAPLSGDPRHNIHANDIDFQIESDFIGLMTPGLPRESNRYCDRVGRVMNSGDGLYGGMFVCGMYSAAFFEADVRRVVEQGLACIPASSGYAEAIRGVLDWSAKHPDDWRGCWQYVEDAWDKNDSCTDGALQPFNIDARLNGAYIAIGLLYGGKDFAKTLEITARCGQDSDCNPSSAAGVLGAMLGYSGIPERWKAGIEAIAHTKFRYTSYSFDEITRSTVLRALKVVRGAGGTVTDAEVAVPRQEPRPPKLEQWSMGVPDHLVGVDDGAWSWKGGWAPWSRKEGAPDGRVATGAGAEVSLTFQGTAVALVGPYSQDGGRADVYLDGRKAGSLDAFVVERTWDNDLWHAYGLRPGPHSLKVVTRGDSDPRSRGRAVVIERAIVYRGLTAP
jgi:hypothetical protein